MIKSLIFKNFCLLIGIFSCLLTVTQTANAASPSLGIDPPLTAINIIPPAIAVSPINIQNKDDSRITLRIQIKPFKANGENGELEYFNDSLEIFKNIQILDANTPVETITLEPKQTKKLNLSISIQQDMGISDYYFSIIFISTDIPLTEASSSVNRIGIATNVLLSIGPLETPKAILEEFSSKLLLSKGPVSLVVRIKNLDTHFIKPQGEIIIKNIFGQNVGRLNLTRTNVLSDSIRAIPNDIYMQELRSKENPDKKTKNPYDFKHPVALWKENFLLGPYTATLNISMSDKGPIFTKNIYFFAFPLQALAILIAAIIAVTIIIRKLKRYANKNRM